MRKEIKVAFVKQIFKELAERAKGPGCIYVTGGITAVLFGFRKSTVDIDLKLLPEPPGIFDAIRDVKDLLNINIELASPDDFIPALPGWRERSKYIATYNEVEFFHYDFYGQALSKIERNHVRDLADVDAMLKHGLVEKRELQRLFLEIEPLLIRYPAIDPPTFKKRVEAIVGQIS
ncbi:MAG TPA: DUF6036 family nucleotidyltransferase [Myxococcota bacterium]|nr:DUF6036 family nucleotidyltransferase [Myxococcota bacterium]